MSKESDRKDMEELSWYTLKHESCANSRAVTEGFAYSPKGYLVFACRCTLCGESFFLKVSEEEALKYTAASVRKGAVINTDRRFYEIATGIIEDEEVFLEIIDAEGLDPIKVFQMGIGSEVVIVTMDVRVKRMLNEIYGDSRNQLVNLTAKVFVAALRIWPSTGRLS